MNLKSFMHVLMYPDYFFPHTLFFFFFPLHLYQRFLISASPFLRFMTSDSWPGQLYDHWMESVHWSLGTSSMIVQLKAMIFILPESISSKWFSSWGKGPLSFFSSYGWLLTGSFLLRSREICAATMSLWLPWVCHAQKMNFTVLLFSSFYISFWLFSGMFTKL